MSLQVMAVLGRIRDADLHREGGIRCLRLFGARRDVLDGLLRETALLRARAAPSRPGEAGHVTAWTRPRGRVAQYSLLTASGRYDDFSRDHDLSSFGKRFWEADRYPLLAALVGALPDLVNVRLLVLAPGAALPPHEEHALVRAGDGTIGVRARFHLPLETGPAATITLDGAVYHLEAGTIHLVNHGCVHAAENAGAADRVHLVWDQLMTFDAATVMFGQAAGPPGFARLGLVEPSPIGHRPVREWERLAPPVTEAEAAKLDFLRPQ
ncbi:aspartyl/asparaginyl beta-hydroxylase domain-containing protein [[Actinomadura] parvosata]|uniref:aspartyl/asparaginyl beta-hydroxylase domain-containing protein n=1 Tax=[Actinomadura] parvosata TaxID=1955412 RepID=UPI00406C176C